MKNTLLMLFLINLLIRPIFAQDTNSDKTNLIQDSDTIKLQKILPGSVLYLKTNKVDYDNYWAKLGQIRTVFIRGNEFDEIYAGIDINTIPGEYLLSVETSKKQLATYKLSLIHI